MLGPTIRRLVVLMAVHPALACSIRLDLILDLENKNFGGESMLAGTHTIYCCLCGVKWYAQEGMLDMDYRCQVKHW